uniref:Uncharacterized protein n=1 Tax=viral metagenome TaxID=1070528 RepID=A0A6C0HU57_9ZZZZ
MDVATHILKDNVGVQRNMELPEKSSTDTSDFPAISKKFAYLPNGIIREIIAYTGATYKKRNGKYMGQIPKTDPRFTLLLRIPKKQIHVNNHLVSNPNCKYFHSWVRLTRISERYYKHPTVRLAVFGVTYTNDPIFGNKESIEYECRICDRSGNVRFETYKYYEYYQKNKKLDDFSSQYNNIQSEIDEIKKRILIQKKSLNLLRNACIMTSMFTVGLIVQYFRN